MESESYLQIQQKMELLFYESIKKYLLQKCRRQYIIQVWYCVRRNNFWKPFRISVFLIYCRSECASTVVDSVMGRTAAVCDSDL